MMPPGTLEKVIPHAGNATCLDVTWSVDLTEFPLPNVEIEDEKLKSQIEITAQGQVCTLPDTEVSFITL